MTATQYKTIRIQLGLSQAGLAALLCVTRATINAREAGRTPITEEASRAIRSLSAVPK